jgi:hypothetical protein
MHEGRTQNEISSGLVLGIKTGFNAKLIWWPLWDKERDQRGKLLVKTLVP